MIKVMSFNIRYGLADDGENHWHRRKWLALARMRLFGPDLLGLQECRDDGQAAFVRAGLPAYHFFGIHREGPGDTALEMAPLLVRRSAFTLLEMGCFWLSETPEIPGSRSWNSAYPRTVIWARLTCRRSGRVLIHVNTHFDYEPTAVDGAARCLRHWLDQHCRGTPVLVTGDFNAGKTSFAHQHLTKDGTLVDAFRQVHAHGVDAPTFHGFGREEEQAPLDWILVSPHFRILEARVDRFRRRTVFPSDHYPLTAVLDWRN